MKIKRRPAFFIAAALITGILSSYFLFSLKMYFLFKILMFMEITYLSYFIINKLKYTKRSIYIFLTIIFLILGSFLYAYQDYKFQSNYSISRFTGQDVHLLAKISFDMGDLESDRVHLKPYYLNGQQVKYGKIILNSEKLKDFNDGDLISLELELSQADPALNPGSFSYADYLKKQGIYAQGFNVQNIKLLQKNRSFKNIIIRFKKILLNNVNYLFTDKNAAFIKAILLGEKEYLSYEQESLLRNAGASHLLAISGLHIGIIILTFSFILFKLFSKKKNALCLLSFLTLIYIIIVGAAVSIIRAALLVLIFLWADQFKREGDFLNIISITLIINLLIDPLALFTVSLQLSYILVLALFYLTPLLSEFLHPILAVSLSAQLASIAITAYYFNEYAYIALITNLWAIPYITFLLPLIFIIILLSLISAELISAAAFLIEYFLEILFKGLELMTHIQGRALVIAEPELIIIILYYLLLFTLPIFYKKRYIYLRARKFIFWQKLSLFLLIIIISLFFIQPKPNNLEISFAAVGQGDGILIQFPGGKNMLVDTGPPGIDGRNVEYSIISYLNYLGLSKIDYLMISHFDADHAGGISHLLRRKKINNLLIPPFKEKTIFHNLLAEELINKNIKLNYLTADMSFEISECRIDILNPEPDLIKEDRNENSIVFLLTYQKNKFLFTGDISKKGEARIIENYELPKIDILKAGHHGSRTSSGEILLDALKPELAVVSVGKNNFGHPSAEVIERFEEKSIKYLRTDKKGMIKVISDGENIFLKTFR
ncbi:MAG: DNA internalization-related competence protein ComEC/Rec2 [Halanaerobium sp.]